MLHAQGLDPMAALAFTLELDFEGDQYTFFKFSLDEIRALYGIEVQELNVWRPMAVPAGQGARAPGRRRPDVPHRSRQELDRRRLNRHRGAYRAVFSQPRIVHGLLAGFRRRVSSRRAHSGGRRAAAVRGDREARPHYAARAVGACGARRRPDAEASIEPSSAKSDCPTPIADCARSGVGAHAAASSDGASRVMRSSFAISTYGGSTPTARVNSPRRKTRRSPARERVESAVVKVARHAGARRRLSDGDRALAVIDLVRHAGGVRQIERVDLRHEEPAERDCSTA